ncbi:MAG: type II toxin-antitoxin system HicB family antitoxin [Candidatus Omnitrophota bacterium]|jgi:predicted HicB family RNase H-like nuclease|nr:MAG: type II toxin-antitoxin system HicB family antitoxin [Candidatus Omnitrophota bacterium]
MKYKGYHARIVYDESIKEFHGRITGIRDMVNFHASSVEDLEREFRVSVDDYLLSCKETGREPERTYSGQFVVRLKPELHRKIASFAEAHGKSMNEVITEAMETMMDR